MDTSNTNNDSYLKPRKKATDAELRLFLLEVDNHCPLCGKELQSHKQKKISQKKFQIAHIYPNSPTDEQLETFKGLEKLGEDSESFENKIALCLDCHATQDFHTTKEEYIRLVKIKKSLLIKQLLNDKTIVLGLEDEIKDVIHKICELTEDEITELNYKAVLISNKFYPNEYMLKSKVKGYVDAYFTYIRDLFRDLIDKSNFDFENFCIKINLCFKSMDKTDATKTEIFNSIVSWINNQTCNESKEACEAIVSYFVQSCEVFYEITK